MINMNNTAKELQSLFDTGYIDKSGEPLKCRNCNSNNLKIDKESYGPAGLEEYEMVCKDCNNIVGFWSYGYWQV